MYSEMRRKSHPGLCEEKDLLTRLACILTALLLGGAWLGAPVVSARPPTTESPADNWMLLPTDVPIQLNAKKLIVRPKENLYIAEGNVRVIAGGASVSADAVSYNDTKKTLTAQGNVIVRRGSDLIEADKFTIRFPNATAVIYNGKLRLTRRNIYLEGKKLEKVDKSRYRIEQGSFTTCDGLTPDWRIRGSNLDVTLEGYATLTHGIFYLKGIPVFYLPWFVYPAKAKRQTGFLTPTLSNSSQRGIDLRFPFFVDISPSVDMTLVPRICTRRAAQTALEFRYVPFEDVKGRFYGEYTYDWEYARVDSPVPHRFYATWNHYQNILGLADLKVNGNWVSDRDYFDLWGGRLDRRQRKRFLESNAILYHQGNNFLFQAEVRHFENLDIPDNAVTVQHVPVVTGRLFNQKVPYTPFYLSSEVVYDHFLAPKKHKQWLGSRLQVDTRVSLPLALGRYLKVEPSMSYFPRAYAAGYYENDRNVRTVNALRTDLYQVHADLYTDLDTIYRTAFLGFQRIRHAIRPRFTWTYRPETDQMIYPYFDESDRKESVSVLNAELRQTLTGRIGPTRYLDFMTLSIYQGFDFNKLRDHQEANDEPVPWTRGWTNTLAEFTLKPHSLIDLIAQAEYDPVHNRARKYSVNLGLMDHRGDLLRVLHQFTEDQAKNDLNQQTNVNLQVKLLDSLDCFFENQFTHKYDFSYYTSLGLVYHPQCWNISLRYSQVREQDRITREIRDVDQTVYMSVSLYGLGQIYRMTRDWSEILGAATGAGGSLAR